MTRQEPYLEMSDGTRESLTAVVEALSERMRQDAADVAADVTAYLSEHPGDAMRIAFALNDARVAGLHLDRDKTGHDVPDTHINRVWAQCHRSGNPVHTYWRDDHHALDGKPINCAWDNDDGQHTETQQEDES